jgi:hypothetical protein
MLKVLSYSKMRDVAMQFYRIDMTPASNEIALLLFSLDRYPLS